jgi:tetratricopeptide (TPR) repeat protein
VHSRSKTLQEGRAMSRTLSLIRAGWESVRTAADRGRHADALDRLNQLLRVLTGPAIHTDPAHGTVHDPEDDPAGAFTTAQLAEAYRFAGELAVELGRYAVARRHLKAAVALTPDHAVTYYLMGRAWEEDPDGCDRRAAICYKKATGLDAANALHRAAFGRAAARCGKVKLGTREVVAAADAAAGDVAVIRLAVSALLETGKVAQARRILVKARFLCPGQSDLAALWERVKFESARHSQMQARRGAADRREHPETRYAQDAQFATDGDRVTIPFVRPVGGGANVGRAGTIPGGTVRCDLGSFPRPHLARLRARKADR